MKKQYIIPTIEIEQVEEVQFLCFSKTESNGATPEVSVINIEVSNEPSSDAATDMNAAKGNNIFELEW